MSEVLRVTRVPRSTWYDQQKVKKKANLASFRRKGRPIPGYTQNPDGTIVLDSAITNAIESYRKQPEFFNGGGVDKLRSYLRRDYGFYINRKKIYRICLKNGFLLPRRGKKGKRKGGFISQNRAVTGPNQLWEFDIKYGYIHGESRFFFVLAFVDVFTRKCVGRHVGLSCKKGDLCFVLKEALEQEEVGAEDELVIRSDNGPQMRSKQFHEYLEKLEKKLEHEFIPVQTPNKNAHVESFFSILEMEFIQVRYFRSFAEAYVQTHEFIDFYNEKRIHGSLGMKTPEEILNLWKKGQEVGIETVEL